MARPALEVADIFREHGAAWRRANAGHVSLGQLKVMSAIERCRTAALGGHVARCETAARIRSISFNSCRSRSCPKCQGSAARKWLAEREAELLEVGYFHLVFTLPAAVADIAWQNKEVVYGILFKAAAETMLTIAADPRHLGARDRHHRRASHMGLGDDASSAHPHDRARRRPLGRRHALDRHAGQASSCRSGCCRGCSAGCSSRCSPPRMPRAGSRFFGALETLAVPRAFAAFVKRQRRAEWVTYAKAPFAGPKAVLAYLARYTHRIAISNRRLIRADADGVTFTYKDYRVEGPGRYKTMTLATHEFIRRFLMHVLPKGFHRIRHYGLLANGNRAAMIAKARELLAMAPREAQRRRHRPPRPAAPPTAALLLSALRRPDDRHAWSSCTAGRRIRARRLPPSSGSTRHEPVPRLPSRNAASDRRSLSIRSNRARHERSAPSSQTGLRDLARQSQSPFQPFEYAAKGSRQRKRQPDAESPPASRVAESP